ncbi:MAG: hypothetical protein KAT74_05115 [Candidatus Cloacimonetes bacterium]|nr:hypothetical protein [Candidatus Cloacimonadota bacterium]
METKLKYFIFLTDEGFTFQPKSDFIESEMDNLQVLGLSEGLNTDNAIENFIQDNKFLKELNFDNILVFELISDKVIQSFSLKERFKWKKLQKSCLEF